MIPCLKLASVRMDVIDFRETCIRLGQFSFALSSLYDSVNANESEKMAPRKHRRQTSLGMR